jgi:hypothetical protein
MDESLSTPITPFQQLEAGGIEVWSSMQHSARIDNCASVFESIQKVPAQTPLQDIVGTLAIDNWLFEEPDAYSSSSSLSLNDAANTGTATNTDAVSLLHFSRQAKLILLSSFRIRHDYQQWLSRTQRKRSTSLTLVRESSQRRCWVAEMHLSRPSSAPCSNWSAIKRHYPSLRGLEKIR